MDSVHELAALLNDSCPGTVVAVTGAGVSAASGLPTFRGSDPDAIWNREITTIATRSYFRHDPVAWWRWFIKTFDGILDVNPNAAHIALARLESWVVNRGGRFLLITQNVDLLHERAGTKELVKVHGTADRFRCSRDGCELASPRGSIPFDDVDFGPFLAEPRRETIPKCSECGDLVRPHALLFDEYYGEHVDYEFSRVEETFAEMALVLFVGTSFSVGITEMALRAAALRGIPTWSIDPNGRDDAGIHVVRGAAETALPDLVDRLEAS